MQTPPRRYQPAPSSPLENFDLDDDLAASLALARQLQEEESLNTFQRLQEAFIYDSKALQQMQLTLGEEETMDEDLALALRLAQQENQPRAPVHNVDLDNMSYEQILQLQEQIGDVKQESWSQRAKRVIQERCEVGTIEEFQNKGYSLDQCLICQHKYHPAERILRLPCGHMFHYGCSFEWLSRHDTCCLCKKSIEED